jgi:hypothetical protein
MIWLSFMLAACGAGARLSGDEARSGLSAPPPESAAPAPATAAGPAAAPAAASGPRDLTEAKVICWGKVEREQQRVRTIDQRIAYVERCVAEQMKGH